MTSAIHVFPMPGISDNMLGTTYNTQEQYNHMRSDGIVACFFIITYYILPSGNTSNSNQFIHYQHKRDQLLNHLYFDVVEEDVEKCWILL